MSNDRTEQMGEVVKHETRAMGLRGYLEDAGCLRRFADMLGNEQRAAQFVASIMSVVNGSTQLQKAEPRSIVAAAAVAASLDLPIVPSLGYAHLVPYKNKAQFQIGWKGLVQLAQRSGRYATIHVTNVYAGQLSEYNPFTGHYEFNLTAPSEGEVIGYYAYFKLTSGFEKGDYMTVAQCVEHAKKFSQGYGQSWSWWSKDFDTMGRKTVLKRLLSKWGPMSVNEQTALAVQADEMVVDVSQGGEFSFSPDDEGGSVSQQQGDTSETIATSDTADAPVVPAKWRPSFWPDFTTELARAGTAQELAAVRDKYVQLCDGNSPDGERAEELILDAVKQVFAGQDDSKSKKVAKK